jgi:hypothetical protein
MKRLATAAACLLLIASCQDRANEAPGAEGIQQLNNKTIREAAADSAEVLAPKLVKTAGLQLRVSDVNSGSQALSELVRSYGGSISHLHLEAPETTRRELPRGEDSLQVLQAIAPSASVTLRVPSEKLEAFLFDATKGSSFVHSSDFDVDDRTLSYVEAQWRATARERFLASKNTSTKVTGTAVSLNIRDEVIDEQLEQRRIDASVRFSVVHLDLSQPPLLRREVIVNTNLEHYTPPFSSRLADSMLGGWGLFESLVIAGAWLWVFFLAAGLSCVIYMLWKRRQPLQTPIN